MLRIATILHPTDFSAQSENAFHLACALARDHGGQVIVLHVVEPLAVAYGGAMMVPPPGRDWKTLEAKLHGIRSTDAKVPVQYRLEEGMPAAEILRAAQESKCDLIVMGTHGRTGLAHMLMGSVAEHVLRKATCSVLVVKTPFPENPAS